MNIVVSRFNKNIDWIYKIKDENILVYDKQNDQNIYNIPVNKGNEASVYLKYIIDFYNNLPEYTFFIHDDEYAWHHTGSIINKYYKGLEEIKKNNTLYININDKIILGSIISNPWYNNIMNWYNDYIEQYIPMNELPNKDWTQGYYGSAQFFVHKSLILNLPLIFYKNLYNWIITTNLSNAESGRYLEWTWHLFWVIYPKIKNKIINNKKISNNEIEKSEIEKSKIPIDFNWKKYLINNKFLLNQNINSQKMAINHYMKIGIHKNLKYN